MLLLVAGLVVIVLVILVVVFLSVRSMRANEGSDNPARSAGRNPAGRDRASRGGMRREEAGRQPGRRPAEDDWLADDEPGFSEPEHDQARGTLPRPRSHQHDEDSGRRAASQKRDSRRRQRQDSGSRVTGSGRDKSGADWLTGDWGEVSDEQYWAELSADKPLATTARSAQAEGGGARAAAATWGEEADPADTSGRGAHGDPAPGRSQREPATTMAAAGAPTAQFSLHPGPARPNWTPAGPADPPVPSEPPAFAGPAERAAPAEPWTDPVSTGSVDTDPSIGARGWQDGGWRDAAGDSAAWQAPGRDEPAARDSRAWAEDPLTSPSFSESGSYPIDSRSYGGSPSSGSSSYAHGYDHREPAAWEDSYSSRNENGWRDSGHEYPGGGLDPLPGPAASAAEPDGGWSSAPASPGAPSYRQPHESWDPRATGYDDASRHDSYTDPGLQSWPDRYESAGYDPARYDADHGRDSASSGYYGDTGYDRAGYDPAGHGQAGSGYGQPGYSQPGYDQQGYGQAGYGQAGYGTGEAGYRPSQYGSTDTGYDLPDYDRGYQRPGHGTPDADYGPAYGSGASDGSFGQESGNGHYPGYDAGRR